MKGREGGAEGVSYFTAMDGLGSDLKDGTNRSSSHLRRRLGRMLRSSSLSSACSLTARNVSVAVQEPVFVSSRRLGSSGDFRRLERVPSLPSSTASSRTTGNAVADPRRWLLAARHGRSDSTGSGTGGEVARAVDLGVCRPLRKEQRASGRRRSASPPPLPALLMVRPVSRSLKQASGIHLNAKRQPPLTALTEASSNGSRNGSADKEGAQLVHATAAKKKKMEKGKAKSGGVHLSSNPYGFTSSSSDESDGAGGDKDALFSSDDGLAPRRRREDETETRISSDSAAAGVESYYYYRPCRSNSSGRRKPQQLVGVGSKCRSRGGGKMGSRAGSIRFDVDEGFRPLVSLSSSTTGTTTTSMVTAPATAACSSSTTTTTSGTSTGSSSSPSTVDGAEKKKPEEMATATPQHIETGALSSAKAEEEDDAALKAKGEDRYRVHDDEDDGYAVVKESSDPYSDFRSSALEMIMERQMFGSRDLERLLGAFLSLNHPSHHPVILHVFSEIWQALFDNS